MTLTNEQLLAFAHDVRVGISIIDLVDVDDPETWVIVFNNPASNEASRSDVVSMRGELFLKAFPAVRNTPFIRWYQDVLRKREPMELPEVSYGDSHVPEAAFRVWLSPLPGTLVLGQYVNVTEQRRAEGRLRQANAVLEQEVERRTAELTRSKRALREVAYASAHDLMTPIAHVTTLLQLLDREPASDRSRELLAKAARAASGIRDRVDALLHYTTAGADAPRRWHEAEPLVSEALEATKPWPDGIEFTCNIEPRDIHVNAEGFQLVVRELVSNAIKFTPKGQLPRVGLTLTVFDQAAVLSVADQGVGIGVKHHTEVFQAFHRLNRDDEYPGIGMGLALARVAVEAHDGKLEVESTAGNGSKFVATFADAGR